MDCAFASILHAGDRCLYDFVRSIFGGAVSSLEYIEERLSNIEEAMGIILNQKWEFKYISNTVPHLLNDEIIFASQDGWELVCVVRNGTFSTAYMKRKIK